MAWLSKRRTLKKDTMSDCKPADLWNSTNAIFIGSQHVSGLNMHISCDVKYMPTERVLVCKTISTSDPTARYDTLAVSAEINTADGLIAFITARTPWLVQGYTLSEDLQNSVNAAFNGAI